MKFKTNNELKGVKDFALSDCKINNEGAQKFDKDEVPMGCCEGCWSGCIGGPQKG